MVEELKPCSYCGGKAELWERYDGYGVFCEYCGWGFSGVPDKAVAIKNWNAEVTESLKLCPFCGGEAYLSPEEGNLDDSHEVCCSNCGGYAWGDSLERAVNNWNRRSTMSDVNHPDYYQGGIEVINFVESHNLNFNLGNVVKYITRAGKKSGEGIITALLKAQWYLGREIIRAGHELERRQ